MESSHAATKVTGLAAGMMGMLTVGAGLMYFMDPHQGRRRRAVARDKMFSFRHRAGKRARSFGRHLGNRMKGVVAHVSHTMTTPPDEPPMRTAPNIHRGVAASHER